MSIGGILPSYPAWMTPENRYYEGQQQQQDADYERDRAFQLYMQLLNTSRDVANQGYYDKLRALQSQGDLLRQQQSQRQYLNSLDLDRTATMYQRATTQVPSSVENAKRMLGYG